LVKETSHDKSHQLGSLHFFLVMAIMLNKLDCVPMFHFPLDVVPDMTDVFVVLLDVLFVLLNGLLKLNNVSFNLMILKPILEEESND
jgi:hypothetical protein